jgi:hypothetical protein
MRAVVFAGTRSVAVEVVPDAVIEEPDYVVVRISSSAICGTDLHMYHLYCGVCVNCARGLSADRAVGHLLLERHLRRPRPHARPPLHGAAARPDPFRAGPAGVVVTHHGGLEDAPGLYRSFAQRADGVIKAVLRP